jgi:NAD(P)-dependent dehydrogenase (short-subunit alcohol dehydrogenase family)
MSDRWTVEQIPDQSGRVALVTGAHRMGRINFDDLHGQRRYRRWRAYAQSKLANLIFALELDRRLRAAGSTVASLAAHPGYAATNLQSAAAPVLDRAVMAVTNRLIAQDAQVGALSLLYAATQPGLEGGTYVGPDGRGEQRGHPQPEATPTAAALDEAVAARLWAVSEEATGVHFDLPSPSGQLQGSAAEA